VAVVATALERVTRPSAEERAAANRRRSEELLRKANELVALAIEVRDGMRRVTSLYEEREYGTAPERTDAP
jgi:hypothetical protein